MRASTTSATSACSILNIRTTVPLAAGDWSSSCTSRAAISIASAGAATITELVMRLAVMLIPAEGSFSYSPPRSGVAPAGRLGWPGPAICRMAIIWRIICCVRGLFRPTGLGVRPKIALRLSATSAASVFLSRRPAVPRAPSGRGRVAGSSARSCPVRWAGRGRSATWSARRPQWSPTGAAASAAYRPRSPRPGPPRPGRWGG